MDEFDNSILGFDKFAKDYAELFKEEGLFQEPTDFLVDSMHPKSKVLDLGCGPGNFLSHLVKRDQSLQLVGVDLSPNMIQIASEVHPKAKLSKADIRSFTFDNTYDVIILSFVIPYLNKEEFLEIIQKCSQNLSQNGLIYLSFMEGDYSNSCWISSSKDPSIKSFTHYYSRDFILDQLKILKLKCTFQRSLPVQGSKGAANNDYVMIWKKELG